MHIQCMHLLKTYTHTYTYTDTDTDTHTHTDTYIVQARKYVELWQFSSAIKKKPRGHTITKTPHSFQAQ